MPILNEIFQHPVPRSINKHERQQCPEIQIRHVRKEGRALTCMHTSTAQCRDFASRPLKATGKLAKKIRDFPGTYILGIVGGPASVSVPWIR